MGLIHFSGHGSQIVQDKGGGSRREDVLCPSDQDSNTPLTLRWLEERCDAVASGVHLAVTLDCGYSGTVTRAILAPDAPVRSRYLPMPQSVMSFSDPTSIRRLMSGRVRRHVWDDPVDTERPEVMIRAARFDQTAADVRGHGGYHGAMTHAFIAALYDTGGELTYRNLHTRITDALTDDYWQTPQLRASPQYLDHPVLKPFD